MTEEDKNTEMSKLAELAKRMEMMEDQFEKDIQEIDNDATECHRLDKTDIDHECIRVVSDTHKYNTKFAECKRNLVKIERIMNDTHGKLYEKYSRKYQIKLDTKYEVEEWISRDPYWQFIKTRFDNQKVLADYLDRIVKSLNSKSFIIKNIIENKKIELR